MKISLINDQEQLLITLLKKNDFSKRVIPKIKYSLLVNGKHQNLNTLIFPNDLIEITLSTQKQTIIPKYYSLEIIYEDEYLIVINKPANLNTIPDRYSDSLMNYVRYYFDQQHDDSSIHVVTRLDKNTSGLVLIAKHTYIHAKLQKESQLIKKTYRALVRKNHQLKASGDIKLPIKKSSTIKRIVDDSGDFAHTRYEILTSYEDCDLVNIELLTGRTHQIRVHFAYFKAFLFGDSLYSDVVENVAYHTLHCYKLQFKHPITHQNLVLVAEYPIYFSSYIK